MGRTLSGTPSSRIQARRRVALSGMDSRHRRLAESGRYSSEQLLQLAEAADAGFDRAMFADTLGALGQISDAAFAPYGADAPAIQRLRQRFADWRNELSRP